MMTYLWVMLFLLMIANIVLCDKTVALEQEDNRKTANLSQQAHYYKLNVTNRETAVVGSTIRFEANLQVTHNNSDTAGTKPDRFIYQWMDTATKRLTQTVGYLRSSSLVSFDCRNVTAGDYLMTVAVYQTNDPTKVVAFQTNKFTLTEQLNGRLELIQKLNYQRYSTVFSTKKTVILTADMLDEFLHSDLGYSYFWYQDERPLAKTQQGSYTTIFSQPFNSSLASYIFVHTKSDNDHDLLIHHSINASLPTPDSASSNNNATELLKKRQLEQENKGRKSPLVIQGTFQKEVIFKDPIDKCVVVRIDSNKKDRAISLKKTALVKITCAGSIPSSVCINITELNTSLPLTQACQPTSFLDTLNHRVTIEITTSGWKDVHFVVYNDISRYVLIESFYGYDPDSVSDHALTIPIVFGVFGIFIFIVIAGVYFTRLRKKAVVEVANFDFHPSLTHSQAYSEQGFSMSRAVNTIRSVLFPSVSKGHMSSLQYNATQNPRNCSYVGFYDSL